MKRSTVIPLPMAVTAFCDLAGCEWIAGIEDTTIALDAMRPADATLPADANLPADGRMTNRPNGGGGGEPDGGSVSPDASGGCPTPCPYNDAFGDFDGTQNGRNGRWRYVEVQPETDSYVDMSSFTFPGELRRHRP